MQIRITSDGMPIYVQIINQIKYLVSSGRLSPGDELPPIRVLAEQLVVNPNTVARAYRELEMAGWVTKKHGSGTYISESGSPLTKREKMKILTERADALLSEAAQLGFDLEDILKLMQERYKFIQTSREGESK